MSVYGISLTVSELIDILKKYCDDNNVEMYKYNTKKEYNVPIELDNLSQFVHKLKMPCNIKLYRCSNCEVLRNLDYDEQVFYLGTDIDEYDMPPRPDTLDKIEEYLNVISDLMRNLILKKQTVKEHLIKIVGSHKNSSHIMDSIDTYDKDYYCTCDRSRCDSNVRETRFEIYYSCNEEWSSNDC